MEADIKKKHKKTGPKGPWKYTPEVVSDLAKKLLEYVKATELPMLQEFAGIVMIPSSYFTSSKEFLEHEEFSAILKIAKEICIQKWAKAAVNQRYQADNKNPAVAIFILKNMGLRDTFDIKGEGLENRTIVQIYRPEIYALKDVDAASRAADGSV